MPMRERLLLLDQFDAAIFRAPVFGSVVGERFRLTDTLRGKASRRYTIRGQPGDNGLCTLFREDLICGGVALIVRVPFDAQLQILILVK
jgi:hypothetical protein